MYVTQKILNLATTQAPVHKIEIPKDSFQHMHWVITVRSLNAVITAAIVDRFTRWLPACQLKSLQILSPKFL